ncbi:hypothetical protein [Pseudomonas sp.]|uniref:hypothetical protein n=1 Tax=Pseudomonas sp. TaxID=306 RepID=UPI00273118CF|nr:hypothetical protein [Pseudomonas sp.]MDP2244364.1 hypothetical protein [Pseudomonas sp.]
MSRRKSESLKKFAQISLLAFSISATVLGGLHEARSTIELYRQGSKNIAIEYISDTPVLYPGNGKAGESDEGGVEPIRAAVAFVLTRHAGIHRSGCPFMSLTQRLAGFTYVVTPLKEFEDSIRTLIVENPSNPFELAELRSILRRHSAFFAFDDGTGIFHSGNTFMGQSRA